MDAFFERLGSISGGSVDQVKLITCMLVSYPLANLFTKLPYSRPWLRHLFNIGVSTFYLLGVFHLYLGWLQLVVSSIATYMIAKYYKSQHMPWVVFVLVMGHMFITHIQRTVQDIPLETFEISGPQMVLTIKLTSFAWNIFDGQRPESQLDKAQLSSRIVQYPSILEFLGHALYFPGLLVGHSSDFNKYKSMCDGTLYEGANGEDVTCRGPRGRKRVAGRKAVMGLAFLAACVLLSPRFSYAHILRDEWLGKGRLERLLEVQVIGIVERIKYYAVWTLAEGACIVTGMGFSGYDAAGRSTWDAVSNIHILWVELAPNLKVLFDSWNIRANIWLRETVYKRVTPKDKKPGFMSTMITFTTSAIWHGTYPGYYATFIYGGFGTPIARLARQNLRPLFLHLPEIVPSVIPYKNDKWEKLRQAVRDIPTPPPSLPKRVYDILGTIATLLFLNFMGAPFTVWYWRDTMEVWSRMDWYGIWMVALGYAFFYGGGAKLCKELKEKRLQKAENDTAGVEGEYVHPTLRTEDMKGIGMNAIPPVDEAIIEFEEVMEKAIEKHKQETRKKQ